MKPIFAQRFSPIPKPGSTQAAQNEAAAPRRLESPVTPQDLNALTAALTMALQIRVRADLLGLNLKTDSQNLAEYMLTKAKNRQREHAKQPFTLKDLGEMFSAANLEATLQEMVRANHKSPYLIGNVSYLRERTVPVFTAAEQFMRALTRSANADLPPR